MLYHNEYDCRVRRHPRLIAISWILSNRDIREHCSLSAPSVNETIHLYGVLTHLSRLATNRCHGILDFCYKLSFIGQLFSSSSGEVQRSGMIS